MLRSSRVTSSIGASEFVRPEEGNRQPRVFQFPQPIPFPEQARASTKQPACQGHMAAPKVTLWGN